MIFPKVFRRVWNRLLLTTSHAAFVEAFYIGDSGVKTPQQSRMKPPQLNADLNCDGRSWGSWWTEGQMGNVWVPTDPEMKRMVEFSAGNFCWEFLMKCWWFCKGIIYQNMPEKKIRSWREIMFRKIFLSYNGSAVFFEGMVPVVWLELLLKNNMFDKIPGELLKGTTPDRKSVV